MHPFFQFFFWIIFLGGSLLGRGCSSFVFMWFVEDLADAQECSYKWTDWNYESFQNCYDNNMYQANEYLFFFLLFIIPTILLLIFGILGIVRFFKLKKKAIQDVAKICLEECER